VLLRQQREREAGGGVKSKTELSIIGIWNRFIGTLQQIIVDFDNNTEEFEGEKYFVGVFSAKCPDCIL
jgi:hypothetical protein